MKKILIILLCFPIIVFGQNTIEEAIQSWVNKLYLDKQVGPPCDKNGDYIKWVEENPDFYWGLQEIKEVREDFNNDGIRDAFVFFDAQNCVGGNGRGSDFAAFIFSSVNSKYKLYTNLSSELKEYIRTHRGIVGIEKINDIVIDYTIKLKSWETEIEGHFYAWTSKDASCCPSIDRSFSIDLNKIANNPKFNGLAITWKK